MKKKKIVLEDDDDDDELTAEFIEAALKEGTKNLTQIAMDLMGSVVTIEDGWCIRKYKDGKIEKIKRIRKVKIK